MYSTVGSPASSKELRSRNDWTGLKEVAKATALMAAPILLAVLAGL